MVQYVFYELHLFITLDPHLVVARDASDDLTTKMGPNGGELPFMRMPHDTMRNGLPGAKADVAHLGKHPVELIQEQVREYRGETGRERERTRARPPTAALPCKRREIHVIHTTALKEEEEKQTEDA